MSSEGKDFDRELFAVGDQKVCILLIGYFKVLQQTFWNTNSGGKIFVFMVFQNIKSL